MVSVLASRPPGSFSESWPEASAQRGAAEKIFNNFHSKVSPYFRTPPGVVPAAPSGRRPRGWLRGPNGVQLPGSSALHAIVFVIAAFESWGRTTVVNLYQHLSEEQ